MTWSLQVVCADALKLVAKKLQSSLAVEGDLLEDGLGTPTVTIS